MASGGVDSVAKRRRGGRFYGHCCRMICTALTASVLVTNVIGSPVNTVLPPNAGGSIWAYHADPPSDVSQLQYASRNEGTEAFIPGLNNPRVYTHDTNLLRNMLGAVDLDGNGELGLNEIIEYFASNTMQKNRVLANNIAALFYESDRDASDTLDLRDFNEFLHVATGGRRSEEL
eukprot:INCI5544.1.p1 GENE.INCI5544.1~~INCI5544.1.p1  ORF type:complete len:175 (+),score=22.85 INCI5544.1:114-638(+)